MNIFVPYNFSQLEVSVLPLVFAKNDKVNLLVLWFVFDFAHVGHLNSTQSEILSISFYFQLIVLFAYITRFVVWVDFVEIEI